MQKNVFILFLLTTSSITLVGQATKVVLLEEGTGTWCAWCPEGKVVGHELVEKYKDQLIFIEVHRYDEMAVESYVDNIGFQFYPSGHIDRNVENVSPPQWELELFNALNEVPPANVKLQVNYDDASRELKLDISAELFENLEGDYRLAAIVVENSIFGDNDEYSQENIFADNKHGEMGGFENLPSTVPYTDMVYDYVSRHLIVGFNGDSESLPIQLLEGNTYSYSYKWTLPERYNDEYIWIVGLMINNETGQVVNAIKSSYISGNENAKPLFVSEAKNQAFKLEPYSYNVRYHDPDFDLCVIESIDLPSWLTFKKGKYGFASLEGTPTENGIYQVRLQLNDNEYSVDQYFEIVVEDLVEPEASELKDDFRIVPNPVSDAFKIEYTNGVTYQIFDHLGRLIKEGQLQRNADELKYSLPISTDGLIDGMYFLKVSDLVDFEKTKKFVVGL